MPAGRISQLGPLAVEWHPANVANWDTGRAATINLIVVHDIEGGEQAALSVFADPTAAASAHCVVGDPGRAVIDQCVDFGATAWAAGNDSVNRRSLNVELPGFAGRPYDPDVLAKAAALVGYWSRAYNIPLTKLSLADLSANGQSPDSGASGICGHMDVPDPNRPTLGGGAWHHGDPGSAFDWPAFLALAAAGGGLVEGGGVPTAQGAWFPRTGFVVAHGFWQYWRARGGLAAFGYPLTREFVSTAGITGQWFERARLEWHPGSSSRDWDVMLGLVGEELMAAPPAAWAGGITAATYPQEGV